MVFQALLLLASVFISQQQMCPMNAINVTTCDDATIPSPGVWISNVREDGGPSEGGTAYGIKWDADTLLPSPNYSLVIRVMLSGLSSPAMFLMPTDRVRLTIRTLIPNVFYEVMVCREGMAELDFNIFHSNCGNCRFCFLAGSSPIRPITGTEMPGFSPPPEVDISLIAGLVISGVVLTGLIAVLICICFIIRKKKKKPKQMKYMDAIRSKEQKTSTNKKEEPVEDTEETSLTNPPRVMLNLPKSLIFDANQIQIGKIIGQGEFGVVYKGCMKSDQKDVAIKTLKGIFATDNDIENLSHEILKMVQFDHPNVMSLIGVCIGHSCRNNLATGPCVVMPFMARGSLLDQLRQHYDEIVVLDQDDKAVPNVKKNLTQMCLQVAKGMEYLTYLRFLHRDLAARNCLVDLNGVIKVSDFGLAEDIYSQNYFCQSSGSTKLPIKWMSIESITQGKFSEKTDVWSYGVTCWEIFTGGTIPYPGIHPREVVEYLENGDRLKKPKNAACDPEVFSVMQSCWNQQHSARPTFSEIVSIIERYLEGTTDYLDLSDTYKKSQPIDKTDNVEVSTSSPISEPNNLPKVSALPIDYYYSS